MKCEDCEDRARCHSYLPLLASLFLVMILYVIFWPRYTKKGDVLVRYDGCGVPEVIEEGLRFGIKPISDRYCYNAEDFEFKITVIGTTSATGEVSLRLNKDKVKEATIWYVNYKGTKDFLDHDGYKLAKTNDSGEYPAKLMRYVAAHDYLTRNVKYDFIEYNGSLKSGDLKTERVTEAFTLGDL